MSGQLIGDLLSVGGKVQEERDSLQVQLQESERLRQEAFQAYETMRLERDEWKAAAEYQQQQAMELRQQVEALESSLAAVLEASKKLIEELAVAKNEASKTGWVLVGSHLPNREQLDAEIVRLTNNLMREAEERKALQQQLAELQAQLEAAAVTPTQQPDGTAEGLATVRRMIGEIWGWHACVSRLDEVRWAEAWEQVGALLGDLQQESQ